MIWKEKSVDMRILSASKTAKKLIESMLDLIKKTKV